MGVSDLSRISLRTAWRGLVLFCFFMSLVVSVDDLAIKRRPPGLLVCMVCVEDLVLFCDVWHTRDLCVWPAV